MPTWPLLETTVGGAAGQAGTALLALAGHAQPARPCPLRQLGQPTRDGGWMRYRSVAFLVQRCVPMGWAPDAVPAMSAWITSAVRVRLLEEMEWAGWENTVYNDTDGLIVLPEGYSRLGSPVRPFTAELGALTLRGSFMTWRSTASSTTGPTTQLCVPGCPVGSP
jgi:hypothetical protein